MGGIPQTLQTGLSTGSDIVFGRNPAMPACPDATRQAPPIGSRTCNGAHVDAKTECSDDVGG